MSDYLTIHKLAEEVKPLFGQVVLVYRSEMGVLCGVGEDEHDLYYIVRPKGRKADIWYSAVGHCEGLKDHLPVEMYSAMEKLYEINGGLPTEFVTLFNEGGGVLTPYDESIHPAMKRQLYADLVRRAKSGENKIYPDGLLL